jgi:hypothetical protein
LVSSVFPSKVDDFVDLAIKRKKRWEVFGVALVFYNFVLWEKFGNEMGGDVAFWAE